MMHEPEKSDRCVVPRKSSNNAVRTAAEGMEGRRLVKGRPVGNARSGRRTGPACHLRRRGPVAQLHGSPKPERRNGITQDRSPVRESRTPGSARGAGRKASPYRDRHQAGTVRRSRSAAQRRRAPAES
jgi:hypothetical protein